MPSADAAAGQLTVTTTADSGPGSLRQALADAAASVEDDTIVFQSGVTGTILLTSGQLVAQLGGSSGNLIIQGPGADELTLNGNDRGRVLAVNAPTSDPRPSITISGVTLSHGAAGGGDALASQYPEGDKGGGLRSTGADVHLSSVVVSDNQADDAGGGVQVTGGDLSVEASTITRNRASSGASVADAAWTAGDGGGISADNAAVIGSTVSDNVAAGGPGGGVLAGSLTATDSTFDGNSSGGWGGGIAVRGSFGTETGLRLALMSTTVAGNHARDGGGGVSLEYQEALLTATTIASNVAPVAGGLAAKSVVQLRSSILSGNTGGDLGGPGLAYLRSTLVQELRGFQVRSSGTSCVACFEDPHLGPLQDNGGPTETMLPASDSRVIDRGEAFDTTDQRGLARTVGAAADMGAVEMTTTEQSGLPGIGSYQAPSVEGIVRVGERLTTDGGEWDVPGVDLSYQWLVNGWRPIPGATSSSYVVQPSDYSGGPYSTGARLSVLVTATAPGHQDGSRQSDLTAYPAPGVMTVTRPASLIGRSQVGEVLRVSPHRRGISPRPHAVRFAWWVGDRFMQGYDGQRTLELRRWMRGQRVTVFITYRLSGYAPLKQRVRSHPVR